MLALTVPSVLCCSLQIKFLLYFQVSGQSAEASRLHPQALGLYGNWLAESKSENPNTIIEEYLKKVSLDCNDDGGKI